MVNKRRFFLELLWLRNTLPNYHRHMCILSYDKFITALKKFISEYTYNFLKNSCDGFANANKILDIVGTEYSKKPKCYPLVKIVTAEPIDDKNISDVLYEDIKKKFPEAFIVEVVDKSIVGGCILEIDESMLIDASYRTRLDNIMNKIETKLKCL